MAWYNASWSYRVKVTALATKVDADLTDFPIYVDLSDLPADFHTNVKSDGSDIRVTEADGTTEVPREIVAYDAGTDTGEIHFKGDVLNASDVDFYIYYGNAGASDYATTDTYGRNNVWTNGYTAVYHSNQATSANMVDSVGAHDATPASTSGSNPTTTTSGKLGSGYSYLLADQRRYVTDIVPGATFTWQVWANPSALSTYHSLLTTSSGYMLFDILTGGVLSFWSTDGLGGGDLGITGMSTGTFYKLDFIREGASTTNGYKAYKNGVVGASPANTGTWSSADNIIIGSREDTLAQSYSGVLDEVRISSVARGATWLSTEYNNQNDATTFFTIGTQETNTTATTFTNIQSIGNIQSITNLQTLTF